MLIFRCMFTVQQKLSDVVRAFSASIVVIESPYCAPAPTEIEVECSNAAQTIRLVHFHERTSLGDRTLLR